MRMIKLTKSLSVVACLFAASVNAADILIDDVRIVDSNGMSKDSQDVLIQNGKISNIASQITAPEGALVIDGSGKYLSSGFFNGSTQMGTVEVSAASGSNDTRVENENITASFRLADAFNRHSVVIPYNRSLGLSHALVLPSKGKGLFSGVASVVNLSGEEDSIEVSNAGVVVNLGARGGRQVGGSRAAALATLKEAIEDVRDYARNKSSFNAGSRRDYALSRHDLEALVPVVNGKLPLIVNVDRAVDIEQVLKFAKKQNLKLILAGVAEGWRVADKIAKAKVPVIVDPIENLPSSYDRLGSRLDNVVLMNNAGVTMVFTGMGRSTTHNANLVRQSAANAVANGLPYEVAVAAMTTNPAKVFGISRFGNLSKGDKATLVVWSGDPLEMTSNPDLVMVKGKQYSLDSRSTRLRDRYLKRIRNQ